MLLIYMTEKGIDDMLDLATLACPQIAAHLRQTAAQDDNQMDIGAQQGLVSVELLIPLFQTLGRLHSKVDVKVHNLQVRGLLSLLLLILKCSRSFR